MAPILRRSLLGGALALTANTIASRSGISAPAAQLWQKWAANDPASRIVIDHQAWGIFLRRYLVEEPDGIYRLRYSEVSTIDKQALGLYLEKLSNAQVPSLNPSEQFSYWINLYNALTIKTVLDHYPVTSIREISLGGSLLPSFITGETGPWHAKLIQVGGEEVALDDIEHRILRPLFKDNRIHYAVNCASVGCPTLMPTPFTATGLQAMLDRCARLYVNHPRGVRADASGLTVSSIYKWYQEDFGGNWQSVLAHLRRYANSATTQMLAPFSTIHADTYDWQLNDAATDLKTMQEPERR
jgi:hypothetical protein